MFDKLDVSQIISDHVRTLHKFGEEKIYYGDVFVFFGLPAICAALILYVFHTPVDRTAANIMITSLSIFSALLLNLLMLLYDLVRKEEEEAGSDNKSAAAVLLREIFSNISYSIVVSVFCVAILLLAYLEIRSGIFLQIFSLVVYFLLLQFLLTLFMVLKRVHVLLSLKIIGPIPPKPSLRPRSILFRQRLSARRSSRGSRDP